MDRYQNDRDSAPKLKPVEEPLKLQYNEIGIKSDIKGLEIKRIIDKVVNDLVYAKEKRITLKSRGKACSKLISIVDILRRKIHGLHLIQRNYSTAYIMDTDRDREKTIQLPCMDAILLLENPNTAEGYFPPKNINELDENYIDPKNPPPRERQEYHGGFRGRGRGGMDRGYYRGRGNFRGDNNYRGNQYRGRGRGRGGQRGYRGNYGGGYYNNRNEGNENNDYGMKKYHQNSYYNYNKNNNNDDNNNTNYSHNYNNNYYNNRNEERVNTRPYTSQGDNDQYQQRHNIDSREREDSNTFERGGRGDYGGRGGRSYRGNRGNGRGGRGQFFQYNNNNRNNFQQDEEDEDYVNFKHDDQSPTDSQPHSNRGGRGGNDRGFSHYARGGNERGFSHFARGGNEQRGQPRGNDFGNRGGRFMMRGRGSNY